MSDQAPAVAVMPQRVSMIMVGACDIPRLRRFYEQGLGWTPWRSGGKGSIMYKVGYSVLVFLDASYLAKERGRDLTTGSKSSLAIFVGSRTDVDEMLTKAVAAGASITSPARQRDGGLYSGYFADPEDNSWEFVWAPAMPLAENGELVLNA
jgi:predicted lactoylglutathione lyase